MGWDKDYHVRMDRRLDYQIVNVSAGRLVCELYV